MAEKGGKKENTECRYEEFQDNCEQCAEHKECMDSKASRAKVVAEQRIQLMRYLTRKRK